MRQDYDRVLGDPAFEREFRVLAREGEGGMGLVLKAIQLSLGRTVAVKILLPSLVQDEDVARRLEREARLTSDLKKHENIVRLLDYGRVAGLPYVVYEFVEGESLSAVIRREAPMKLSRAADLTSQLLAGLSHAHKNHIIHRDIKPENALIDKFNNLKVMDFGIALDETGTERLTRQGMIIGTPVYMAPEQAQGRGVTPLVDVYAAGVILYEMLSGRIPWVEDSALGVLAAKVSGKFTPLEESAPHVPDSLCKLVNKVLDPSPARRPQGAIAFRKELEAVLAGITGQSEIDTGVQATEKLAPRAGRTSAVPAQTATQPRPTAVEPSVQVPEMPRLPIGPIAVLVLAALVLAGGTVAFLRSRPGPRVVRGAGDRSFQSATAAFLDVKRLAVVWHQAEDVAAEASVYRADGAGEVMKQPLKRAGQGKFEAVFVGVDPFLNYSFSVSIPGLLGAGEASETQTLDGIGAVVEQLRTRAEAVDVEAMSQAILEARQSQRQPAEVAMDQERKLYPVVTALKRFLPLAPTAWGDRRFDRLSRMRLQEALSRLQELDWRAQACGVRLPLELSKALPSELLPGGRPFEVPLSECGLGVLTAAGAASGPAQLVPRRQVSLDTSSCNFGPGTLAQLAVTLTGSVGKPYFLKLTLPGSRVVRMHGVENPGPGQTVCQAFDLRALTATPARPIALELCPMEILTLPAETPGIALESAALRVR